MDSVSNLPANIMSDRGEDNLIMPQQQLTHYYKWLSSHDHALKSLLETTNAIPIRKHIQGLKPSIKPENDLRYIRHRTNDVIIISKGNCTGYLPN